jgi:diaminopimelate decarboxylase
MDTKSDVLTRAEEILSRRTAVLDKDMVAGFIRPYLEHSDAFKGLCRKQGSPLYVFDEKALLERTHEFKAVFQEAFGDIRIYFAMKSNNHPMVSGSLIRFGTGLDVSSGIEMLTALDLGCRDIIFSGPGKTQSELELAVKHKDRVTILIDSFGELDRLATAAALGKDNVRAGVRLTTQEDGLWRKFGIPLSELRDFFETADRCSHVNLCGIQFHTSWNLDPSAQTGFIARLGSYLDTLDKEHLDAIEFIDIGGGYWPARGEWLQWAGTQEGKLHSAVDLVHTSPLHHYICSSVPIQVFADRISSAIKTHITPKVSCSIYAEPGRWLCNDAMHVLLKVVDKKTDDLVITDAGTNLIGWERFETDYFPVINLTRPSLTERQCTIFGSLCTPHDIWGYGYFGEGIEAGDVLLVPCQGAYTFSLRQNFIKPLPKVVPLKA